MQDNRKRGAELAFWLLSALWLAVVFLLSRQTAADSGALSSRITEYVLKLFPQIELTAVELDPILRKIAHGMMFAVEGMLLGLAAMLRFGRKAGAALAAGVCALLAVGSELVQTFADGRSCELRDMGIDLGGAVIGILAVLVLMLFIDKLSRLRMTKHR